MFSEENVSGVCIYNSQYHSSKNGCQVKKNNNNTCNIYIYIYILFFYEEIRWGVKHEIMIQKYG